MIKEYDVIILGAGAAGLMCAVRASQRGKRVVVLDHGDRAGAKILISGGGRCNFTNRYAVADRYQSNNPHFCKSALKTFSQNDFVAMVEKHHIAYHEKTLGQLFCDDSAQDILTMLLSQCALHNADVFLNREITNVEKADLFTVQTQSETFTATSLVLATGGLSIPKMGSTNFTHEIAQKFGLQLTEMRAGLAPLLFGGDELEMMKSLSGVSQQVSVRCGKKAFKEALIFTHKGLSGPAILQISSYWTEGSEIAIDLLPDINAEAFLIEKKKLRPKAELKTILSEVMTQRLAQAFVERYSVNSPIGDMNDKSLRSFAAKIKNWQLNPLATEGFDKAEVTIGGVDTKQVSSKTMEVSSVAGLYIVGEALDVTGWLGGYNMQWAWSSGWAAGSAV